MTQELKVASVEHLENGGTGIVFEVTLHHPPQGMSSIPAFAVRFRDQIVCYKNICGHIAVNLDLVEGHFFDETGENLVCSTHGAFYQPSDGKCLGGPCYGVGLESIDSIEKEGYLYITDQQIASIVLTEKK